MMTAHETENFYRFELELWGKIWTSRDGDKTRFYLDHDAVCTLIGLDGDALTLDGEQVSNKAASRLSMGSWWIEDGVVHGDRDTDPQMVAKAAAKLTEMMTPAVETVEEEAQDGPSTEHATYNNITGDVTVEATITAVFGTAGADLDVDAIAAAYREAINASLPDGVTLNGDLFFGPADFDFDRNEIAEIIDNISIGDIAKSVAGIRWTNFEDALNYVAQALGDPAAASKATPTEPDFVWNLEATTREFVMHVQYSLDEGNIYDGQDLSEILEDLHLLGIARRSCIYVNTGCTVTIALPASATQRPDYACVCRCGTEFRSYVPWVHGGLCADHYQPRSAASLSGLIDPTRAGL